MGLSNLMGLLQQYAGGGAAKQQNVEQDFDHVSQNAPQNHLAGGIANAFRSNQTPPFPQLISQLFSNSNGQQQAGILSRLISAAGPSAAGSGGLSGLMSQSNNGQITPDQAQQISPGAVHDLAAQAERNNPSIVDEAGSFYAQHPTLVKALGAGALALVMSHMSQNRE